MDFRATTERYEAWLRASLPVVIEADLDVKHQQMAAALFPFLRATFYRWAQRWGELCPHLTSAPVVLGVGDLHVENYGTWRDSEGRLVWGINDFDEATHLPYPADLVRLATSAAVAAGEQHLSLPLKEAADAILVGYQEGLSSRGQPFVLAEHHNRLRRMATGEIRDPVHFWAKMHALPAAPLAIYPPEAVDIAMAALPGAATGASSGPGASSDPAPPPGCEQVPGSEGAIRSRRAGLGSLGRPRLVALRQWEGGNVAREVKAVLPSAWDWAQGRSTAPVHYAEVVEGAVRCADPFTMVRGRWLIRRLAPDCARIELSDLPAERDETILLRSMGFELANIHLGTAGAGPSIGNDLAERSRRHPGWLVSAAERMAADTQADWTSWKAEGATNGR